MSFWSKFSDSVNSKVQGYFDKRKEDREEEEKLRTEQRRLEKLEFEKAFKDSARKAARIKAQRDAASKTGLGRLRALNRADNLKGDKPPMLSKLSEYMQKNLAKREENLRKSKMLQDEADKMKQERLRKPMASRESFNGKRPFSDLDRGLIKY